MNPSLSNAMSLAARLYRASVLLALTLASAACGADLAVPTSISHENQTAGIAAGYVRLTATAAGLSVSNQTERPVHLFAVNAETLALLDWVPCTGGSKCPPLAPGASREIPWAAVAMYEPNVKQYTVYWWNVTVQPDGSARADNLHNMTISR